MIITKKQAQAWNIFRSQLCDFHVRFPDQTASMYSCRDCKIIQDKCGCREDEGCEYCEPDMARLARSIIGRKYSENHRK